MKADCRKTTERVATFFRCARQHGARGKASASFGSSESIWRIWAGATATRFERRRIRARCWRLSNAIAQRIAQICAGDVRGYWSLVQEGHDDLKWCGSSPLYTFLKVMPDLRGELLDYHHWQIDPQSVVTFGAIAIREAGLMS